MADYTLNRPQAERQKSSPSPSKPNSQLYHSPVAPSQPDVRLPLPALPPPPKEPNQPSSLLPHPLLHPHTFMPSHSLSTLHRQSLINPITNSPHPLTLMPPLPIHPLSSIWRARCLSQYQFRHIKSSSSSSEDDVLLTGTIPCEVFLLVLF